MPQSMSDPKTVLLQTNKLPAMVRSSLKESVVSQSLSLSVSLSVSLCLSHFWFLDVES